MIGEKLEVQIFKCQVKPTIFDFIKRKTGPIHKTLVILKDVV